MTDVGGPTGLRYIVVGYHSGPEKKCTLHPLQARRDVEFRSRDEPGEFGAGALLLYPDGEVLTPELGRSISDEAGEAGADIELVLVDCRWRKADKVLAALPPMRRLALEGYVTGAERKVPPPEGGLASVEALYVAGLMLGMPDPTLLEGYHYRERFLELNAASNRPIPGGDCSRQGTTNH